MGHDTRQFWNTGHLNVNRFVVDGLLVDCAKVAMDTAIAITGLVIVYFIRDYKLQISIGERQYHQTIY